LINTSYFNQSKTRHCALTSKDPNSIVRAFSADVDSLHRKDLSQDWSHGERSETINAAKF
jgi:hypothetical protein